MSARGAGTEATAVRPPRTGPRVRVTPPAVRDTDREFVRGRDAKHAPAPRVAPQGAGAESGNGEQAGVPCGVAERAGEPGPAQAPTRDSATARRFNSRALRTHFGTVAGVVIVAVLLWRLGTGVLLDGLRRIDTGTVLVSLGIGAVTTVLSAWRWQLVARGLRIRLPLGPAVADYYRALFLNAALPGGILGDVHRAVRHGQSAGDLRRAVKAVVLERVAGQVALAVSGAAVLLTLPSPVRAEVRGFAPLVALAAAGALAVVLAVRMNRAPSPRGGALGRALREAREGLLSRQAGPGVALSSAVVLAGHLAMFVVAARVAGSAAPVAVLVPLAVLALIAMGLPVNVGGFGPREGVTAWAFGAAGLGASTGVAVAVVYGVLSLVASLPGAAVLVARWYAGLRTEATTADAAQVPTDPTGAAETGRAPTEDPRPDASRAGAAPRGPGRTAQVDYPRPSVEVSSVKYGSKESARLVRSSFPFSAEPRDGRPMTPDSV
ncbi:lysylphosphatidylglycerol synthase transmembrane domain-containing protein [Streptomyces sp. NPDC004561]